MNIIYHVSRRGLPLGTMLMPDYYHHKEKISIFVRACCQGPEIFVATLASAQYADTLLSMNKSSLPNANKWATEGLFEFVRCFYHPNRPARYQCVYGFESMDLAARFLEDFRKDADCSIYKCACEPSMPIFHTDMALFTKVSELITKGQVRVKPSLKRQFPRLLKLARSYWRGPQTIGYPEILVTGTIQVLEELT